MSSLHYSLHFAFSVSFLLLNLGLRMMREAISVGGMLLLLVVIVLVFISDTTTNYRCKSGIESK